MFARIRLVPVMSPALVTMLISACGTTAEPPPAQPSASATAEPSASTMGGRADAAVWTLAEGSSLQPSSTRFTAVVTRLGCNNGVTGDVLAPAIRLGETEVVVTFTVAPKASDPASCPGNDQVRYEVVLDEPLRGRALVDGQCRPGGEAVDTAFCHPGSTRS
jgi:hypothetical protein